VYVWSNMFTCRLVPIKFIMLILYKGPRPFQLQGRCCLFLYYTSDTHCPHSDLEAHHEISLMTMYCDLPDQWCFEFILIILTVIFLFSSSLRLQTTSDVSLINNDCYFVNLAGFFFLSFLQHQLPTYMKSWSHAGKKKLYKKLMRENEINVHVWVNKCTCM
jgi:hypothetical protein